MEKTDAERKPTVAYVPFKTFMSALDALKSSVPANINRSVWPTTNGVMVSQLIGAFKFLGLIHPDGRPTDELHHLVENSGDDQKRVLANLLTTRYTFANPKELLKMDPNTLNNKMREYGINGATLNRATTFFLQAARYAGVPLSPYLTKKTRGPSVRKKKAQSQRPNEVVHRTDTKAPSVGPTRSIELKNGGTLTLTANTDMFQMTSEDRGFVLKLLDLVEAYERERNVF